MIQVVVRYQSAIHDEGKTPGQDCGVCTGSQDGSFQGPVDNPGDDDDDHNDCGVCAGPQDWFFQGPVEQILPSHQLTGASHRISELSKSQISQCRTQIFRIFNFFISTAGALVVITV